MLPHDLSTGGSFLGGSPPYIAEKAFKRVWRMHEFSLALSMVEYLEKVAKDHGLEKVLEVHVRLGGLTHVNPGQLAFAFKLAAEGTVLEGAKLKIKRRSVKGRCLSCGKVFTIRRAQNFILQEEVKCPRCGSEEFTLVDDRELVVERIKGVSKQKTTP